MDAHELKPPKKRVCILSGGGDAPGVNAILRAFVHASRSLSIDVLACHDGLEGLLGPNSIVPFSIDNVRGILPRAGSCIGCSTRVNPFFVEVPGLAAPQDRAPLIVDRLRTFRVDALVLVGGDGTMLAAQRFHSMGMPSLGIAKTIDNDLGGSDVTCGFDTAVNTATAAVDALHATAEAHARVMVLEVMGRNSGAIALHAGVAGGADVILLPEIPYRLSSVVAKIRERERLGLRFTIVVVSEGARPLGGEQVAVEAGHPGRLPRLGGAGARLARELEALELGHEVRVTVLGYLQRGGSPSAFDRTLGTQLGARAAELVAEGRLGRMVVWRDGAVSALLLPSPDALHKHVDLDGSLVRSARLIGISLGD